MSKRMAQLRAILDTVDPDTAHRAHLLENYRALADVQRQQRHWVAELLSGPQVGAWAAQCLRHLSTEPVSTETPLWIHLAHLGSVAASAAQQKGLRVRVRVPVRSGAVHFPALGRALCSQPGPALVECVTGPDGILLDGKPPMSWEPVRLLRTEADGVTLRVHVDDVDPYWDSFRLPVTRLTDDELDTWRTRLDAAWQVLADRHSHRLHTMAAAIRCLVPVARAGQLGGVSASSSDAPGATVLTEPVSPERLAATLIHESQHHRLATLHDLKPLYTTPSRQLLYSPWRNDPRPLSGVVHGLMAFFGVADFWSRERTGPTTELEYARHVRQLRVAHRVAAGATELTPLGAALVDALGEAVDALPVDIGPPEVRRIADDLVTEHRASWRLCNVVPDESATRAAVLAWRGSGSALDDLVEHAGTPRHADPSGDNPFTRVAMAWLENASEVRALAADEELFAKRFPGATPGDLDLVMGDYPAARDDALARVAGGATDDRTWATLVVAHGHACAVPERSPLVRSPELVRAAFAAISPAHDTAPLLALMSRYEAGTSMSASIRR
ncbi:HEXXH motif domain-containing protein [Actinophytocola sp.]|uniref:HEXXH motif domain-containing protein n=1 Tax=Actinophytocola sp. TaxID=1872138 RepID=UPI002ED53F9A